MPADNTPSYASNAAVRWLLSELGYAFDKTCGKPPLRGKKAPAQHKGEVLEHFGNRCCYCLESFHETRRKPEREHVIPMSADYGGLHSWKNVVYCCRDCNDDRREKHKMSLAQYLKGRSEALKLIRAWQKKYPSDKEPVADAQKLAKRLYLATGKLLNEYAEKMKK